MCRCRFINCKKCTHLVGVIHNGGGYACMDTDKGVLCFETKAALKNKISKERKKKSHNLGITEISGKTNQNEKRHNFLESQR